MKEIDIHTRIHSYTEDIITPYTRTAYIKLHRINRSPLYVDRLADCTKVTAIHSNVR